jgi:hypothetical protein
VTSLRTAWASTTRWKASTTNSTHQFIIANISSGHRNAIRLLAEQSDRERQRQELLAQRKALLQGKQVLNDLQQRKYENAAHSLVSSAGSDCNAGPSTIDVMTPTSQEERIPFKEPLAATVEDMDEEI